MKGTKPTRKEPIKTNENSVLLMAEMPMLKIEGQKTIK
jgi:hypothetical protein